MENLYQYILDHCTLSHCILHAFDMSVFVNADIFSSSSSNVIRTKPDPVQDSTAPSLVP